MDMSLRSISCELGKALKEVPVTKLEKMHGYLCKKYRLQTLGGGYGGTCKSVKVHAEQNILEESRCTLSSSKIQTKCQSLKETLR